MGATADITREILDQNNASLTDMTKLISSGEAISFVGAGLSHPLKYPTWQELLEQLLSEARKWMNDPQFKPSVRLTDATALAFAQELYDVIAANSLLPRYHEFLGNNFKPRQNNGSSTTQVQRTIMSLPFKGWVTTNYDCCLEEALIAAKLRQPKGGNQINDWSINPVVVQKNGGNPHTVSECLLNMHDSTRPSVIHLHGEYRRVEEIILTRTDYEEAYGKPVMCSNCGNLDSNWTLHRKLAWSLLATRRLVFFGFSLTDPYVVQLLESVASDLWRHNEPIHFALTAIEWPVISLQDAIQHEERFREKYGVQLVFYDKRDGRHSGLEHLILNLHAACGDGPHIQATRNSIVRGVGSTDATNPSPALARDLILAANQLFGA